MMPGAEHELVRTVIVGGVGALLSVMAWLIKAKVTDIAGDVRGAVERLNVHATELAKLDLRVERLEVRADQVDSDMREARSG